MRRFLLDTCICLAFIREGSLFNTIDNELGLSKDDAVAIISVVTKAELHSIGKQNHWSERKLEKLNNLLNKLIIIDINSSDNLLIESYSKIDAFSQGKLISIPLENSSRNLGKNDLWIAATADVANATLITSDSDFDHLNGKIIKVKKYSVK